MWLKMKISWVKYEKDLESFKIPERLGFDVFKLDNPEETDNKLEELIKHRYEMIFITNEIASFSENIIKKYNRDDNVCIIIARGKE